MKKIITVILAFSLITLLVSGCGTQPSIIDDTDINDIAAGNRPDSAALNTPPEQNAQSNDAAQFIGEDRAKEIALEHAGVIESEATFIRVHFEYDDGRAVYDVEFYSGNVEYDYEIDAITGNILEFDRDIENYVIPGNADDTAQFIGEDRAKEIALADAGLSESQVSWIRVELDRDDGRMVYEVDFYHGRVEYGYEIDAITGNIIDKEVDYND